MQKWINNSQWLLQLQYDIYNDEFNMKYTGHNNEFTFSLNSYLGTYE